jgi:hypothetical protein
MAIASNSCALISGRLIWCIALNYFLAEPVFQWRMIYAFLLLHVPGKIFLPKLVFWGRSSLNIPAGLRAGSSPNININTVLKKNNTELIFLNNRT